MVRADEDECIPLLILFMRSLGLGRLLHRLLVDSM